MNQKTSIFFGTTAGSAGIGSSTGKNTEKIRRSEKIKNIIIIASKR
jgi:hypothetical protein